MGEDCGTKTKFVKYGIVYVIRKARESYHCPNENGADSFKCQYQRHRPNTQDAKEAFW